MVCSAAPESVTDGPCRFDQRNPKVPPIARPLTIPRAAQRPPNAQLSLPETQSSNLHSSSIDQLLSVPAGNCISDPLWPSPPESMPPSASDVLVVSLDVWSSLPPPLSEPLPSTPLSCLNVDAAGPDELCPGGFSFDPPPCWPERDAISQICPLGAGLSILPIGTE